MRLIINMRLLLNRLVSKSKLFKPLFIILGIVSLIWFLFRVIPKPSRASYPCMQTAFPIASSFVIWLIGSLGSIVVFKKLPVALRNRSYLKVAVFTLSGVLLFFLAISFNNNSIVIANPFTQNALIDPVKKEYGNTIDQLKTKVAVVKATTDSAYKIQYPEILSMVREAVNLSGGLGHLIKDGKTVMLKPNLVNDYPNRTIEVNGATTDYRVVKAVVEILRELDPKVKIILAEGSGGNTLSKTIMTRLKYLEITGIDYFMGLEETSGAYRDFNSDSLVEVNLPDSLSKYPDDLKPNKTRAIYYNKRYFNADVLISIPVLKNHGTAGITGAVKNVAIGCTPANLYADKTNILPYLRSAVILHDLPTLSKWIHDFYVGRPVDFVIMDGLQGGSSGPGVGGNSIPAIKRNQHNMRLILAGKDAVAIDAVAGLIMGHDPQKAAYLVDIHNSGFGIVDPALIDVIGVKVHTVRKAFRYDNTNTVVTTPFNKFQSSDYNVTGTIINKTLNMSVSNPDDLARMTVKVDNQKISKYVVDGFNNISLDLEGINVSDGIVDVYFEDKYLNPLSKQMTIPVFNSVDIHSKNRGSISVFPNPMANELNIRSENSSQGIYQIQIVDNSGKVMLSAKFNSKTTSLEHTINVEKLSTGNYIIRIVYPDGKVIHDKIIKK